MVDIGRSLLIVAVVAVTLGAATGTVAIVSSRTVWHAASATGLRVAAIALVVATATLGRAFAIGDHSLVAVADHSRDALGTYDRVMGLWGGMAGSLLLFTAATACFAVVGIGWRPHPVATTAACVVVGALTVTGRVFADPFATLEIPALDGAGLTPILEHWAMRIHPPLVYAGLTATIVPAVLSMAALADRRLDDRWWNEVRVWLLASWGLLGVGMLLGAHWAYVELGWGGYWAWDPVENAALLPWLAITVVLHAPAGRRSAMRGGLVVLPFLLALVGSTLTRSGATTSVHAFAEARDIGRSLAVLLAAAVVTSIALVVRAFRSSAKTIRPSSPGTVDIAATSIIATVLAFVLAGTLYPLARGWFGGDRLAIEGRFYSGSIAPVVVLGLVALLGRGRWPSMPACLGTGLAGASLIGLGWREGYPILLAAVAIVAFVASSRRLTATHRGGDLAHAGIALLLVGVAGTATGSQITTTVEAGETIVVDGHDVRLDDIGIEAGPTDESTAVVADITVDGTSREVALVSYPDRGVLLAESTVRSTPAVDVQVILRNADDDLALLIVNVSPLQQLVWWGGLLTIAGGLLAGVRGRRRTTTFPHTAQSSSGSSRRARCDSSREPRVEVGAGGADGASTSSAEDRPSLS